MLTYAPAVNVLKGRDDVDIQKAGFLFKQTSNTIRKWKEYYFRLGRMSLLCYRKDTDVRDGKEPKFKIELADIDDVSHTYKKNKPSKQFFLIFHHGALSLRSEELADAKDWIQKLRDGVSMSQKRRELQAELLRASFKMAVEQNVRNKYVHYNPKKVVDEMPKKTFLKRIDPKQVSSATTNKVSFMPPLHPDKRSISIGGNMISKRDSMACFQQSHASPYWKNKNYRTLYKNFNKDSLRKSLLKRNASKERCLPDEHDTGSMIITANLGFENEESIRESMVPVYTSLDGLNRTSEPRMPKRNSFSGPQTRSRHVSGGRTDQSQRFESRMPGQVTTSVKKPGLDRSMSCQQVHSPARHRPKYSSSSLFGKGLQTDTPMKLSMDTGATMNNARNMSDPGNIEAQPVFDRGSSLYSSYNPIRHPTTNFQRDHVMYRSLNSFQTAPGPSNPPPLPRPLLNTISEHDGSSRSAFGSRSSLVGDNKGHYENKALWSKEFHEQITHSHPRLLKEPTISAQNYYIAETCSTVEIPRVNYVRSVSENSPMWPNKIGYSQPVRTDRSNVVTRANTFTDHSQLMYTSGCVPLIRRPDTVCGPDIVGCGLGGTNPASMWRNASCIQ